MIKSLKTVIAIAPPALDAFGVWQQTKNPQQVASRIVGDFSGYDFASGTWQAQRLAVGYSGFLAAYLLGKANAKLRVL